MQGVRRAAIVASSLSRSAIRPQIARTQALHTGLRATRSKFQPTLCFVSSVRTYASEPENAARNAAETVKDAASQAGESLKGTAEATKEFASEAAPETSASDAASQAKESLDGTTEATKEYAGQAASEAQDATQQATETAQETTQTARETTSNAAGRFSDAAQDAAQGAAASMPVRSRAPSNQSSPIRAEGITGERKPSSTLYVGNLYFEVSQKALQDEFSRFGEVKSTKIVYDGRGLSKGFGYIDFENVEQATAAMEALDQQIFEGRRMTIQFAVAQKPRMGPSGEVGFRHEPSKTLYIGNMSYEMSDKDLNDLFREVKNVTDVRVAIDRKTGQPRGYAHADFLDVESATKAADYLKSKSFYGRNLRIDYTFSKSTAPNRSPNSQSSL